MLSRASINPTTKTYTIVGEHEKGKTDETVRGVLITDSDVSILTKNLITQLYNKFPYIQCFEVFHSRLQSIESGAFVHQGAVNMQNILIAFNNLRTIGDGAFDGIPNLDFLRIVNSGVETISENAFRDLKKLKKLSLQYNRIKELPKDVFKSMFLLGTVDISSNQLQTIDGDIFYNSNELQYMYFSYNQIFAIGGNFFAGMHQFNDISIHNNICVTGSFKYREAAMRGLEKCFENFEKLKTSK